MYRLATLHNVMDHMTVKKVLGQISTKFFSRDICNHFGFGAVEPECVTFRGAISDGDLQSCVNECISD